MDLFKGTTTKTNEVAIWEEYTTGPDIPTLHVSDRTSFFPLAMDDYFMAVAILSRQFGDKVSKNELLHEGEEE